MRARASVVQGCRILGTITLLVILLTLIDFSKLYAYAARIHPAWLIMTVAVLVVIRFLMALRWHFILRARDVGKPLREVVGVTFLASSLAPLVPGGLGADLFRGYHFASKYGKAIDVAGTILLDRVIGVYSMLLLASLGALAAWWLGFSGELLASLLVLQAICFAGWAILYLFGARIGPVSLQSATLTKWFNGLLKLLHPLIDGALLRKVLPAGTVFSFAVQLLRCLTFWLLYQAFSISLDYIYFLAFIPLIFLASLLPLSVGGLGVREGALVFFFGPLGVPSEVSFAVGILWYALQIGLSAAIVGVWFSWGGARTLWRQSALLWRSQR